jgi:cytochrome c553
MAMGRCFQSVRSVRRWFAPHLRGGIVLLVAVCCHLPAVAAATGASQDEADQPVKFAEVAQIFRAHCFECHSDAEASGDLRLDTLSGLNAGGQSGATLVPGHADQSLLVAAIRYADESLQMPPDKPLDQAAVRRIVRWIDDGAVHPEGMIQNPAAGEHPGLTASAQFWAFQPIGEVPIPLLDDGPQPRSPVDAFLLVARQRAGITANGIAPPRTLLRRATLTLTGLPPSPEQVQEFLSDDEAGAIARLIDRLLDDTAYGERWGRHWLDVVRYADSNGLDENVAHGNAWRYRDYVIAAFNQDKPFSEFIREQLAGDLLPDEDMSPARKNECLTATGFLALGPKVLAEGDADKLRMDIVDEQIDTVGKAFLGLSLGCARCHDHKFDPITQADYYRLAGIFDSTRTMESLQRIARWNEHELASDEYRQQLATHEQQERRLEAAVEQTKARLQDGIQDQREIAEIDGDESGSGETPDARLERIQQELETLRKQRPQPPTAMGVGEGEIHNTRIHYRGSHLSLGQEVPRGVPEALQQHGNVSVDPESSGRLELADWLVSPQHPLTARVMVNRIWRWHFGEGLVRSTDNFGLRGEPPVNQPLLDWLAGQFIASGWSVKAMHRIIMSSDAWQQSAAISAAAAEVDPDNVLLWRFPRRRLEAEAIRDSILFVSGQLDRTAGGSLLQVGNREFIFNHTSQDATSYATLRRSVYLPVVRNHLYDGFALFDYTDASVPNGDRSISTVPSQSLFLMNGELVAAAAESLATRIRNSSAADDGERIGLLFELCLTRPPTPTERALYLNALTDLRRLIGDTDKDQGLRQVRVWIALCQTMLMSAEFLDLP